MRKSVRVSSVLVTLMALSLTISQVAVFAFSNEQAAAPSIGDRQPTTSQSKKSKKRKKRRNTNATIPILISAPTEKQSAAIPPTRSLQATAPLNDVAEAPATAPTSNRGTSRAARIPGSRISPVITAGAPQLNTVFSNPAAITIVDGATPPTPSSPYPSNITVSGLTQNVVSVTLTITGFSHVFAEDVDMLLVAPNGATYHFWSDIGGVAPATNLNITLDDAAATALPINTALSSGTFRPSNESPPADSFPAPAPAGPYNQAQPGGASTFTSVFGGLTPAQANGVWSLYITDDLAGDAGAINGGWSLDITQAATPPTAGQIIISEFRLRGAASVTDEFIELYNNSGADLTVSSLSGTGLGVAASDGVTRCTVPNGTIIPAGGHYLCVNSAGYTLGDYPAGKGTTATGDATYTTDIPDNAGIALFNNNTAGASYSLANRLDAVGSFDEANPVYKEGTGYAPLSTVFGANYAFYRDTCGKGGSISTMGACTIFTPKDTDDNATDFIYIEPNGNSLGAGQRVGGPGPENLSSPILRNATIPATLLDPCVAGASAPNRVRDLTVVPNGASGTLDIRRTFTNNTGGSITQLRYRIIDITTFPAPAGVAFLAALTSPDVMVTVDRAPCGSGTSSVTVTGTTLEEAAPTSNQPFGGGFNSSLSSGTVTLGTPLANGASIDMRWVFGVNQTGLFKIYVNIEALP